VKEPHLRAKNIYKIDYQISMKERLGKLFQELKDHLHGRFALRFCDMAFSVLKPAAF
jgi:hypothetical protein